MKKYITLVGLVLSTSILFAQTPTDGFFMPKDEICVAFNYDYTTWSQYWEGTLKRDNSNIGTISTQQMQLMGAYGLNKYINLIAVLPNYIVTRASAGTMAGHRGLQDAAFWVKVKPWSKDFSKGRADAFVAAGYSMPVTNYYPDYLPLSIGLGARMAHLRGNMHFFAKKDWFVGVQGAYQWRSNIALERDFYYTGGQAFYTDRVDMPNAAEGSITLGYLKAPLRLELGSSWFRTLGGADIRRNEMPFPSNRMNMQRLTAMLQYRIPALPGFGLTLQSGYTLSGRNVGQGFNLGGGFLYQFPVQRKQPQG
jgi:hypothetical protein